MADLLASKIVEKYQADAQFINMVNKLGTSN